MSDISREYIDQRFDALSDKLDDFIEAQNQTNQNTREDKREIYTKVNSNTTEIEALKQTRPTFKSMIAAIGIIATLLIGLAQLIFRATGNG